MNFVTLLELHKDKIMNLKEIRAEWEYHQIPVFIVSQVTDGYPVVYVVCKTEDLETRKRQANRFSVRRYFPIGIGTPNCNWECSVEISSDLESCLKFLQEHIDHLNKKIEQTNWEDLDKNPLTGML